MHGVENEKTPIYNNNNNPEQRLSPCPARVADSTEPAAAPRSERGDPEAVVRPEAARTSTFYILAALAGHLYLQLGHKVFEHVFLCFLRSAFLRVPDVCTKIPQFPSFDSPKSYRGGKRSPTKWAIAFVVRGGEALCAAARVPGSWTDWVQLVPFRAVFSAGSL